jgi:hypothetical protein
LTRVPVRSENRNNNGFVRGLNVMQKPIITSVLMAGAVSPISYGVAADGQVYYLNAAGEAQTDENGALKPVPEIVAKQVRDAIKRSDEFSKEKPV